MKNVCVVLGVIFASSMAITGCASRADARPYPEVVECPLPPEPQGAFQAVSSPRSDLNEYMAVLEGRFIAVVPDDLQPGCYIITYKQPDFLEG